MAKVKQKVSRCVLIVKFAHAYCLVSSYLTTMANLGCSPLLAISIALKGEAVDYLKKHVKSGGKLPSIYISPRIPDFGEFIWVTTNFLPAFNFVR